MNYRTVKYAYTAYPTARQARWLAGAFGAMRTVYNDYLWQRERVYAGEQAELVPLDKFRSLPADRTWMRQYPQKCAQQAVRLPKEGSWLRFRLSRKLPSKPTGVTLKLAADGTYTLSFTVREPIAEPKTSGPTAAYDAGLIDLAAVVSDDGTRYKVAAPKNYRRAERKLARLSREHSRKTRGSKNRERARLALAKQHSKVARQRQDQARKFAARLTDENQAVALEALSLRGLVRTKLSKSFADAGLGQLAACVEQAAQKRGARFVAVNPAYTSQACSACGALGGRKALSVRQWQCACGALLDRDYNAAVNILLLAGGHSESLNGPGGRISRLELASPAPAAMPAEGATSYKAHRPSRRRTRAKSLARRAALKAHASALAGNHRPSGR